MWLVGGKKNRTVAKYDPLGKRTTTVCELDRSRHSFGACLLCADGDRILVAGGCTEDSWSTDSTFLLDTATGAVEEAGKMLRRRRAFALVECRGAAYAIGGLAGLRDMRSVEMFDGSGGWKKAPFELNVGRRHHCAVAHDHLIYVFGGEAGSDRHRVFDSVERIDTRTNRVETISAKLSAPRSACSASKVGSRVFLLGGVTRRYDATDKLEWFDLEEEKMGGWAGESMPTENVCFTACVL